MVYYTQEEFINENPNEKPTKSYTWLTYSIATTGVLIASVVLGFCDIMKSSEADICKPVVITTCDFILIFTVIYFILSFYCSQIFIKVNTKDDSKSKEVKREEDRQNNIATSFNIYQIINQSTKKEIKTRKPSYDTRIITNSEDLDELYIERNQREEREQQQHQQNHQNQHQNQSKQQYFKYLKPYTTSLTTTIWKYIPSMSILKYNYY